MAAPALANLDLKGSGDMILGDLPVSWFSYENDNGTRVDVYLSNFAFPVPDESRRLTDPPGWQSNQERLIFLIPDSSQPMMVVSSFAALNVPSEITTEHD